MSQLRHRRLIDLFNEAVELPALEREEYIHRMCGDDEKLRAELESLLRCDPNASVVLNEFPTADLIRDAASQAFEDRNLNKGDTAYSKEFAGYEIQRELGSGSMGRVFLAHQISTGQQVALKIIREGFYSPKIIRRFEFEVEVLARLEHPGIARIFDAGTAHVDGLDQPYFAMEYLSGATLLDYARDRKLDLIGRIELMASICEAVHHAHQQGVIHRDLKPENILVTEDGRPKVLDFGVARIVDADVQLTTIGQDMGQLIGTLRYMSPEQASGDTTQLDTRSDVYALGVVAFELLSGKPPYDLEEGSLLKAVRVIQESEPRRLVCGNVHTPSDVETIIAKALEKEKGRRYSSAMELAADLRRFLAFEPISARPDSALYQIRKYARRHRVLAGSLITILLVSVIGMGVSLHYMTRALNSNEEAQWQVYISRILGAAAELQENGLRAAQDFLKEAPAEYRNWEWRYLSRRADQSLMSLDASADYVWCVAVSSDGSRAYVGEGASKNSLAELGVWDLKTGDEVAALPIHRSRVLAVACSSDGTRIASGSQDETIKLLDAESFETVATLEGHNSPVNALAFSPTNGLLASASEDGSLRFWNARSGTFIRSLAGHGDKVYDVCFSPQGDRIASASVDGTAKIWDVATGEESMTLDLEGAPVVGVVFSADGKQLVTGTRFGRIDIWDLRNKQSVELMPQMDPRAVVKSNLSFGLIGSVAYSPNGQYLAAVSRQNEVVVWDTGELDSTPLSLLGHTAAVPGLAWTPDSRQLISGSWDNSVRIWDAFRFHDRVAPYVREGTQFFGFGPDPSSLYTVNASGSIRIEETKTGILRSRPSSIPKFESKYLLVFGPKAEKVVATWLPRPDTSFGVFDVASGTKLFAGPGGFAKGFNADGTMLAVSTAEHEIVVYSMESGEQLMVLKGGKRKIRSLAFSPDSALLAMGGMDNSVLVWDLRSGDQVAKLDQHENIIVHVVFDATGERLATSGIDGATRVWDTSSFEQLASLPSIGPALAAAFHPTEPRLATLASDGSVRVWSTETYEKLLRIHESDSKLHNLCFTPDGKCLILCDSLSGQLVVLDGS